MSFALRMTRCYVLRNVCASDFITIFVIDVPSGPDHPCAMLPKMDLLRAIERRAGSRANMARALGLAAPRITEMFKGERDLSYDEAAALIDAFGVEEPLPAAEGSAVNDALLKPVLAAVLRYAPRAETDALADTLAQAVLELIAFVQSDPAMLAKPGMIEGAVRLAMSRPRGERPQA